MDCCSSPCTALVRKYFRFCRVGIVAVYHGLDFETARNCLNGVLGRDERCASNKAKGRVQTFAILSFLIFAFAVGCLLIILIMKADEELRPATAPVDVATGEAVDVAVGEAAEAAATISASENPEVVDICFSAAISKLAPSRSDLFKELFMLNVASRGGIKMALKARFGTGQDFTDEEMRTILACTRRELRMLLRKRKASSAAAWKVGSVPLLCSPRTARRRLVMFINAREKAIDIRWVTFEGCEPTLASPYSRVLTRCSVERRYFVVRFSEKHFVSSF